VRRFGKTVQRLKTLSSRVVLETTRRASTDEQVTTFYMVLLAVALVERGTPQTLVMLVEQVDEDLVFVLIPPQQVELQVAVLQLLLELLELGMAALAAVDKDQQVMAAQEAMDGLVAEGEAAVERTLVTAEQEELVVAGMSLSSQSKENQ